MKKKAICVLKGEDKKKFDIEFDKFQSYKRTIESLSRETYKAEKLLWGIIKKNTLKFKNTSLVFSEEIYKFNYNYETGQIFEFEQ